MSCTYKRKKEKLSKMNFLYLHGWKKNKDEICKFVCFT